MCTIAHGSWFEERALFALAGVFSTRAAADGRREEADDAAVRLSAPLNGHAAPPAAAARDGGGKSAGPTSPLSGAGGKAARGAAGTALNKVLFEERLILEEALCSQLGRCSTFLLQFCLFMVILDLAYPANSMLAIHQGLADGLEVDGLMPEDVTTPGMLKTYLQAIVYCTVFILYYTMPYHAIPYLYYNILYYTILYYKGLSENWRAYSPGSSEFMDDPLGKSYLPRPIQTPPAETVVVLGERSRSYY